jgi:Methyltransferase domain
MLWSDFLTNRGRAINKWKHYFPAYEAHLSRFVNRPIVFVEIGTGSGGSAQLFKRYLGPHTQIVSIDINPVCKEFEEDQIAIRIGDQADTDFLASLLKEYGPPDIILDDGSHKANDTVTAFSYLYPRMSVQGLYIVEDLHCCYWEDYDGGLRRQGTFIELCKSLIDELNADWTEGRLAPTDFTRSTLSVHFYDSMAVFERGRHLNKSHLIMGTF